MDVEIPWALERWPGYDEQSWSERFAELDRQYQEQSTKLQTALMALAFLSTPTTGEKR